MRALTYAAALAEYREHGIRYTFAFNTRSGRVEWGFVHHDGLATQQAAARLAMQGRR